MPPTRIHQVPGVNTFPTHPDRSHHKHAAPDLPCSRLWQTSWHTFQYKHKFVNCIKQIRRFSARALARSADRGWLLMICPSNRMSSRICPHSRVGLFLPFRWFRAPSAAGSHQPICGIPIRGSSARNISPLRTNRPIEPVGSSRVSGRCMPRTFGRRVQPRPTEQFADFRRGLTPPSAACTNPGRPDAG